MSFTPTSNGASAATTSFSSSVGGPPPIHYISQNVNNLGLAIAISLGFLVLLSAVLLASYVCYRASRQRARHPNENPNLNVNHSDNGIIVPRIIFVAEDDDDDNNENVVVGLDQAVINSYPKFSFSMDRGGGNDSMCSICLCEYKEAEMLRMLPDCRHYFHLTCIDAWLKLNASCPVCRNSPLPTPLSTPLSEVVPLSQYSDGMVELQGLLVVKCAFWFSELKRRTILDLFDFNPRTDDFLDIEEPNPASTDIIICLYSELEDWDHYQEVIHASSEMQKCSGESCSNGCCFPLLDYIITKTLDMMMSLAYLGHSFQLQVSDILGLVESVQASLVEGAHQHDDEVHPLSRLKQKSNEPGDYFLIEEIRKYVRIKPNRLGKQNFMGANGTFTSIGHACFAMKEELEEYMDYDVGDICKDDWKLAQKLMVHGCDPLPRRRCFSRAPQLYSKPFPINESMWKLPDNRNVRWSQYRCKNFACLANNSTGKGFFKCADCFNLTNHEMPRWIKPLYQDPNSNLTADFLIPEVLELKSGGIRIGLDFSVGTGTFAARMKDFNVSIVSATINLGAPFNEMIALRGLVPLYLTINQRLPFFDNTLDLIHTTRFLDGWIDFVLLDFVLFDWDRVLRPGGLLWIDSFFCLKEDLDDYLEAFKMLRYKKHKWIIVPKLDKDDREVFFSAVLEKPPRPFRDEQLISGISCEITSPLWLCLESLGDSH
ncbi:hypothetical protein F0562_019286 [Nyssa sinensis]|uniref:RING-type domain-containing protein n=1 Tax=Nyssa sinensis TaxID=561372 RepID=A0A5J4ZFW6_9ASTE|nr:hypothetical protein F0562_019286 [Nyssa sinensis]